MKCFDKIAVIAFFIIVILSCGTRTSKKDSVRNSEIETFPNVKVPSVVVGKENISTYLAVNYWNRLFSEDRNLKIVNSAEDSSLILGVDTAKISAAFVQYMTSVLPFANIQSSAKGLLELIKKSDSLGMNGDRRILLKLMQLGEYIYYHPNSPYRNEELYIPIVDGLLSSHSLSGIEKLSLEYQKKMLMLNRVGSVANDFVYEEFMPNGGKRKGSLYGIKAQFVIVFFNNPGCEACEQFLRLFLQSEIISKAIFEKKLKILAMYIDEDIDSFKRYKNRYPTQWIYAHDPKLILRNNDIYGIRAIPSIYLLDEDKKVLLKDGAVEDIEKIESLLKRKTDNS